MSPVKGTSFPQNWQGTLESGSGPVPAVAAGAVGGVRWRKEEEEEEKEGGKGGRCEHMAWWEISRVRGKLDWQYSQGTSSGPVQV